MQPNNLPGLDLDAAERWVDDWQASVEERAAKARATSARLAELTATARSADGRVTVTVATSGAVTHLSLHDDIRALPADRIAAQIMSTIRSAQGRLAGLAREAVEETMGADSPTAQALIRSFATQADNRDNQARDSRR